MRVLLVEDDALLADGVRVMSVPGDEVAYLNKRLTMPVAELIHCPTAVPRATR